MSTQEFRGALEEHDAAMYVAVSRSFLRQARMNGDRVHRAPGPPFLKIGRMIRYRVSDLDGWLAKHLADARPAAPRED